ncbi:TetR/AcrR family transcriptional regulator [Longispora sp. K20-0274]|uniref:TetR/AcrR family transcriptional regulator n=1 Tax=Longispora sp. K20-0274 TaxID=3088255 RepID=UPI00399A7509
MTAKTRVPAGAAVLQEDVTEAIAAAAFAELAEVGYGRLSIEAVARRAGVGKTAVYRRWPAKSAMVIDLVTQVAVRAADTPDTGTLHGDVVAYLEITRDALDHPLVARIAPDLLAEAHRNPELAEALATGVGGARRERVAAILHRAVARGELPADTDVALGLDLLAGPLYWRTAIVREPTGPDYVRRLADKVVAALAA